jgi:hypothetical protein
MNEYDVIVIGRDGRKRTIKVQGTSQRDAESKANAGLPEGESVEFTSPRLIGEDDTLTSGEAEDVASTAPLNLTREQLEQERAPFAQFQRGFTSGLGRDPDEQLGGAERRFFQNRQGAGLSSILFNALQDPKTFQDYLASTGVSDLDARDKKIIFDQTNNAFVNADATDAQKLEAQRASQFRLAEAAKNLGAQGVDIFQNARDTFRNLLAGSNTNFSNANDGSLRTNPAQLTALRELTNPSMNNSQAVNDLLNLASGAAQDRYGSFLGSRIIPTANSLTSQFATAAAPEREAGFLEFLGNRLGLT